MFTQTKIYLIIQIDHVFIVCGLIWLKLYIIVKEKGWTVKKFEIILFFRTCMNTSKP